MTLSWMQGLDDGRILYSTYIEALLQALNGKYVLSGLSCSTDGASLNVNIEAGTVKYDGVDYNYAGGSVTLNIGEVDRDRADVIVWDYNGGSPTISVLQGSKWLNIGGSLKPMSERISDTQIPLAVVIVRQGATAVSSSDVLDVRVSATVFWDNIPDKPFESFSSIPSSILPSLGNSYDLGSPTKTWRNGYFAGELDIGGLKIDGTTVFTRGRVIRNFIIDTRYNANVFTLLNFQPNNLYLAHLRGYTITWNDTTGLSNTDNIWSTDMSETLMTINMSTAADPLVLTVLGNLAVSTNVGENRLVVVWHGNKGYNDIKFEVLRNDDVWVEVPLDFEFAVGAAIYQVSKPINPYAPHPTYTPWKGFRITFSNKVTTTGYKYLYGVIYYVPRDPYPYFVRKSGDTIFGTLTAQQINPRSDNTYDLGSSTLRWANIYGVNVYAGDLCFEEKECAVCGQPFEVDDEIVLKAYKIDKYTRTVPIHLRCSKAYKELEVRLKLIEEKDGGGV